VLTNALLIAFAIAGAIAVQTILARLPKQQFTWPVRTALPDDYLLFRIDTVLEDPFKVQYIEEWSLGRDFALYGPILERPNGQIFDVPLTTERTGLSIRLTEGWFDSSTLGHIRIQAKGHAMAYVDLPHQIGARLLDDVRRDQDQRATIGFRRQVNKDGKVTYPICSLEVQKLD